MSARYLGWPVGVLSWLCVEPARRGEGHASTLIEQARAWMDRRGARGREVFVTAANEGALAVYLRHGYRIVDHRMLAPIG